jgi:serine/threonine-protein kinase RsbT
MSQPPSSDRELHWVVEDDADVVPLQVATKRLCCSLGFGARAQWEVAIAVTELATNIVKYAGSGTITLSWQEHCATLVIEARDRGPGLDRPDLALMDHISEGNDRRAAPLASRGLGTGLGAISRMLDELTVENCPDGGARFVGLKRRRVEPLR